MKISPQVAALLPLRTTGQRMILSATGATVCVTPSVKIGLAAANDLEALIVAAVNTHQVLVEELTAAEQIILALLNNMTTAQKSAAHIELIKSGVAGEGMTRYHERRAALELAGAV